MDILGDVLIPAVVFFGIYHILQLMSDYLLRRRLIKEGHVDKVGILEKPKPAEEVSKYPSLKWGLVALMSGLGLIIIEVIGLFDKDWITGRDAVMPFGILLVSISLGFLIYFFIVNGKSKN